MNRNKYLWLFCSLSIAILLSAGYFRAWQPAQPLTTASLVGSWTDAQTARDEVTFIKDGTFIFHAGFSNTTVRGSWRLLDGQRILSQAKGETHIITANLLNDNQLVLQGLPREGERTQNTFNRVMESWVVPGSFPVPRPWWQFWK